MLRFILGRDQKQITDSVLKRAVEPGQDSVLIVVPEQYSHVTERKLCKLGGDSVSARAEVLTFSRLAQRVFQELGGSARPTLDQGGRLLLMHLAVRKLAGALQVYRRSSERAGFLTSLISTADDCKSNCISSDLLLEAGEAEETSSGQRLRELGLIFAAYDALTAQRAEDPRDRLTRLADTLQGSGYFKGKRIYLDGFTDFTPQEKRIMPSMLRQAKEVVVGLRCDTLDPTGAEIFRPTRTTALGLIALARENTVGMEYEVLAQDSRAPEFAFLEQHLFGETGEAYPVPAEQVYFCKAEQPYSEMERVAEEILALVREHGYHFRDISVVSRSLESNSKRLEAVFQRYGIPLFLSRMDDILQKPVLTLLTSALDSVAGGYEYEDVFRYLKTDLTGTSREDRDELENYVLTWDIRGSYWTTDKPWKWHPGGYGQKKTDQSNALIEKMDRLRRTIIAPLEHLRKAEAHTGAEWAEAVYAFLEEIDLPHCLTRRNEELLKQNELQQAEEYAQVWEVLTLALEQCHDLLGEDSMTLPEFADLFRLVLSQYQVGSIPVSLDRVTCSDMARVSHATGKVLFLLDADDGSIPQIHEETGLLTEEDKKLLSQLGADPGLDRDGRMDREMMLVYECCTMPEDRLYVSYAAHGMDGMEQRPSFLVHRLQELFPVGMNDYVNYKTPSAMSAALEAAARNGDQALLEGLAELERGEGARKALRAMDDARKPLSLEAVQELYQGTVRMSASKMDKIKSCHYSYFLQYGLNAKPRRKAGLAAPEAGTFVHYVLEHVLAETKEHGGVAQLEEAEVKKLASAVTERYIAEELGGMEDKTPRFRYLFRRLAQSAAEVTWMMIEELQVSDFEPIAFELGFGRNEALPPVQLDVDGIHVSITGFVDRVDGWVHDGRLYLRVMDYKTGHKSFDLTDIWHGLNLQMLLYLFTLESKGMPGQDLPVVPAGVLYLPAREERIVGSRSMDEEKRRKDLEGKLKRSGLILNDPNVVDAMEHIPLGSSARFLPVQVSKKTGAISGDSLASAAQLGKLRTHIQHVLRDIAREIAGGNIAADPWFRDDKRTACQWCEFASACHFEEGNRGECSRYLYPIKGTAFWDELDEEERGGV